MARSPKIYETFKRTYPKIWQAYDRLGAVSNAAGPLDKKAVALGKLALSIGAKMEGAVHSHTRRALEAGATPGEIRHLVLLGLTTLGFPSSITALSWVEDILKKGRSRLRTTKRR
ncbi:MAG: carboxymuconolactone decarboxylase family protein [Candidatus Binatia bacterium]